VTHIQSARLFLCLSSVFAFDYYFVALQEPQVYKTRIITSEFQNTQRKDQKMAIQKVNASKTELAEVISRYKLRDKRSRAKAKAATEQLTSDLVTVASAAGMGYFMGRQVGGAGGDASKLEEATQLMGVDYDLAISGAAAAIGLTGMAGGMSDFMRSVGIGGLSAYAGRRAFFATIEASENAATFQSQTYAPWATDNYKP
jgi:hypothetical protein